jgi:erythromycin esterase
LVRFVTLLIGATLWVGGAGSLLAQPAIPAIPDITPATAEEETAAVGWLKDKGVAFDPSAYDGAILAPLAERLGRARVIGIGEATHGSHQDQAFKAELIKQLVRDGKVTVLLLEANRDAGEQFDRYVREGVGDPAEVMRSGSFFRIWKNDEFAGLLLWLRAWNQKAATPVRIIGLDCQDGGRDSGVALEFVGAHDPARAAQWSADMGGLKPGLRFVDWLDKAERPEFDRVTATVAAVVAWFETADTAVRAAPGFARARFAAITAQQALASFEFDRDDSDKSKADPAYFARRDRFMGENALAMLQPGERAVLWAHDSHVMEDLPDFVRAIGFQTLGSTIGGKLGNDYAAVGFTWSTGSFRSTVAPLNADGAPDIKTRRNLDVVTLPNNRPGELGNLFDRTGARAMWIDMATRPATPLIDSWSQRPYWRGWAGAVVVPDVWQMTDPATGQIPGDPIIGHDVLVWFQTISPTRLWPEADPPVASAP